MENVSENQENASKLYVLLHQYAPRAIRTVFDREFDPCRLSAILRSNYGKLSDLISRGHLTSDQWHLLYPREGEPTSKTFDITLMVCLIKKLTDIDIPYYKEEPNEIVHSEGSDIATIHYFRNNFSHADVGQIDNDYFERCWIKISEAIGHLSGTTLLKQCDELKMCQLPLIPWNRREQIRKDIEKWNQNDKLYVSTKADEYVLQCLRNNVFVTITGSSGAGKTSVMRHVALVMQQDGYSIIPFSCPKDIMTFHSPNAKLLFVNDDCCGASVLVEQKVQEWREYKDDITNLFESLDNDAKLIVSSRLQITKEVRFQGLEILNSQVCSFSSENMKLSFEEKTKIFASYRLDILIPMETALQFECFPLLCRLASQNNAYRNSVFFKRPYEVYKNELMKMLYEGANNKYCALALCVMFNNEIKEKWFDENISEKINNVIMNTCDASQLNRHTSRKVLLNQLDTLVGSHLAKETRGHKVIYRTIHDIVFELLVEFFTYELTDCVIQNASSLLLAEKILVGVPNEILSTGDSQSFTVRLTTDAQREKYVFRLLKEWNQKEIESVFCNQNFQNPNFVDFFVHCLNKQSSEVRSHLAKTVDNNKNSALIQSCFIGNMRLFDWLLANGADVNCIRKDKVTALFIACQEGHQNMASKLLVRKAHINIAITDGASPLFIACQNGHTEIVNNLLKAGANINQCTLNGASPLCVASSQGHTEIVGSLLEQNANIGLSLKSGESPQTLALSNGHTDIYQTIQMHDFSDLHFFMLRVLAICLIIPLSVLFYILVWLIQIWRIIMPFCVMPIYFLSADFRDEYSKLLRQCWLTSLSKAFKR